MLFKSTGLVYGRYWGGGEGAYPARRLTAPTKNQLLKEAKEGFNGSMGLDSGFECLLGALLQIETITSIVVEGRTFINNEYEEVFIGKLTKKQKEFLNECKYQY